MGRLEVIGDRLLIEKPGEVKEETRESGLVLTTTVAEPQCRATVLHAGEEVKHVLAGDDIFYSPFGGSELEYDEKKYLVLRENEVLAIVTRDKEEL